MSTAKRLQQYAHVSAIDTALIRGHHPRMATQSPSNPRTQAPFAKISIIYALGIQTSDGKVKTVQNLRGFPPSPCCGSIGATPPLKTVLKPSRKPPGKSVNLQDAPPHGLRPGAPGAHRQVMGAAFEPQMSFWDPVVLGGCLGCSIWSINSKRRTLRTMGVP
jgi:hypothetical protein